MRIESLFDQQTQQIKIAVDCIIFGFNNNRLECLLIHRGAEPQKGKWSLIGGFIGNDEDLDEAANRVLFNLSGLENVYMEQVKAFGKANRDPRGRTISISYTALILRSEYDDDRIEEHGAKWFPVDNLPELAFDHVSMVHSAITRLRRRVRNTPIALNLLPEKFTIPQLQALYEGILNESLDKRNFRRKLNQISAFVKLDEKDMSASRRGAFLYTFDQDRYNHDQYFNL
ncbi:NUDIX hydrolase [Gaetbulibacter aestuarii]|uniref:NUDIX domain-containing protein n=1 Tax=Gaetbulibacter aestuarii TaxID=1502358 RepID=A0ABW7MXH4_9FLAO